MTGASACSPDRVIPPRSCFVPNTVKSVLGQLIAIAEGNDCPSVLVLGPWLDRALAADHMDPAKLGIGLVFRNRFLEKCRIVEVQEDVKGWNTAVCYQIEAKQEEDNKLHVSTVSDTQTEIVSERNWKGSGTKLDILWCSLLFAISESGWEESE
jgi:hypothetical protein